MRNRLYSPRKRARSHLLFAATTAAVGAFPGWCRAQSDAWIGFGSNWDTASNWSVNGGSGAVPGANYSVDIAPSTIFSFTVGYNYPGPPVTLASLLIDFTPGTSTDTLIIASNSLTAQTETIGGQGNGALNQSGGTNTVTTNSLYLGDVGGSTGTYNLSGTGLLSSSSAEYVGHGGVGLFNQSGGTNSASTLYVGNDALGTYILSGNGSLGAATEIIGLDGVGTFNQSGGANTAGEVDVSLEGNPATYVLSGGTLAATNTGVYVGGSSLGEDHQGLGILKVSGGLLNTGATGTLVVFDTGNSNGLTLSGGTISTGSLNLSGTPSFLNWTAGTLNLTNSSLTIGTGGSLGATLTLVNGQTLGVIGPSGTLTVANTGSLNLNGGTINANAVSLNSNPGQFNWTAGTLNLTNANFNAVIDTPANTGNLGSSLTLGATQELSVAGSEFVGIGGAASVTLNGGTNLVGGSVALGQNVGSVGTYKMTGASSLSVGANEIVGFAGSGVFNQSSGTNTIAPGGLLLLGFQTGSTGSYTLSGGTLTAPNVYVGSDIFGSAGKGVLTVSGGLLMTPSNGAIDVGNTPGNGVTLSGGTISAGGLILPSNLSLFNWTGGTLSLTNSGFNPVIDTAANGGNLANSLTLGATQELIVAGSEYVGSSGAASVTLNSATNVIAGFLALGQNAGSTGTYTLNGSGSLFAGNGEVVGYNGGVGIFNENNGGTNTIGAGGFLVLGLVPSSTGTYNLSLGTLSSPTVDVGGNTTSEGKGVLNVSGAGLLNVSGTLEAFNTPGTGITFSGGTIDTAALDLNGTPSLFNWTGGTLGLTTGVTFDPGAAASTTSAAFGSSLTLGAAQTLNITGGETIGGTSSFTLTLNGGTNTAANVNLTSSGTFAVVNGFLACGTFNQNGGSASFVNLLVDGTDVGLYNQSGGKNNISLSLNLGNNVGSFGTYILSGGTLSALTEAVGAGGAGSFNQTGGKNAVGSELVVAANPGTTGTYTLSGTGTLSVGGNAYVADEGMGTFNQSGGSHTVSAFLVIGQSLGATGTYILSGSGALSVADGEIVGNGGVGIFNQTGGTNTDDGSFFALGFSATASGTYNLSGGTLAAASIYVGGSNNGAGGTGVLTVRNSGQLSGVGILQVYNSGRVNLDVPNTAVGFLGISGNGIVNLNGALKINYGSPANDPVSSVVGYLKSGYNGGAWTGTAGIISTSITGGGPALSLGFADGNADAGTAAGPNQIVIKYTLAGDANLDGLVNFNDLVAVVQNFNKAGADWAHGNFFYGALTNFNDLVQVVQNFNKTLPPPSGSAAELGGSTIPLVRGTDVQLPEPGALGLAALAAAGFIFRRRRAFRRPASLL